ncbi:MAG: ACP S-malonyltransferase [Eubacteriales bacterium]|nr:ACP S-malonyltransferase [Eubacteriales bacterium]
MGRVAFVFSGQGDQFPGMGRALYETSPAAAAVFDTCEALRPGTLEQCFHGSAEALKQTENTQPCLFAMELAAFAALGERGIAPEALAGFSLGEVAAATAAGLFTLETGFHLVCRRGKLMQAAAEARDTAMAAVVKLPNNQVEALCAEYGVYPVNYNCPGQVSVSGLAEKMPPFSQAVRAAGGRAIPLKVKGAFHSPYMAEAAEKFAEALKTAEVLEHTVPIYSDLTAKPYTGDVRALLAKQICSPVRWEEIIRNLIAEGFDTFIEVGPGRTLTNMIAKIDSAVSACPVSEVASC